MAHLLIDMERTIYKDAPTIRILGENSDVLARYAMEMRTVEMLLNMGFTHCNGVSLSERHMYLTDRIALYSERVNRHPTGVSRWRIEM